ncbi:MAG: hypothetical protein ABJG78_17295 [Cyclobacteriaceae bacterium]
MAKYRELSGEVFGIPSLHLPVAGRLGMTRVVSSETVVLRFERGDRSKRHCGGGTTVAISSINTLSVMPDLSATGRLDQASY